MTVVHTEIIDIPSRVYRVGHHTHREGLWYDRDGNPTGRIHTVPGAAAAALPMGLHPVFWAEGSRWQSVTDTPLMLKNWFSVEDMRHLLPRGYQVFEIEVSRYRRLRFKDYGYAHEVIRPEDTLSVWAIPPETIYEELRR